MPKPACSRPRAPAEAMGRTFSIGSSASPRFFRIRLTARPRSAAVSASVPSKSKRTALAGIFAAAEQVIHIAVVAQAVHLGDRVVGHALELDRLEAGVAAPAR